MAKVFFESRLHFELITVEGAISREDIINTIHQLYPSRLDRCMIWDLRKANLDQIRLCDFQAIASYTKTVIGRTKGKTAYVGSHAVFTQCCMYTAVASMEGLTVEYSAFLKMEDAVSWIAKVSEFA